MRLLKYYLCVSFAFCSCADATPKEKLSELTCPYVLPAEKDFPSSWITLGNSAAGKQQLRETAIIDGNAKAEKERISTAKERVFSRDIIEDWEDFKDRSQAKIEYSENHREMSMMCTYGRTQEESFDIKLNVVLLIPLPDKKPVACLLVRRNIDPTHEISCKVK